MQEIKFTSHKEYWFGHLFFIKAKKTRTNQSTLQAFLLCPNRNDSQTFKSSSCKNFFLQSVCHRRNLLRWMFFISCDKNINVFQDYFFIKVCRDWDFFNRHIVAFFETTVLKEVRILRYLLSNSSVSILMFLDKTIVYYTFMKTFITLSFLTVPYFSL